MVPYNLKTQEQFEKEVYQKFPFFKIDEEYKGKTKKIHYHCEKCGSEYYSYPGDILRGKGCPYCNKIQKQQEKTEFYLNKIKEQFNDTIEIFYEDKITFFSYVICKCKIDGHCWYTVNNLLNSGCPLCRYVNNKKVDNITYKMMEYKINSILTDNIIFLGIEGEYKGINSYLKFYCKEDDVVWVRNYDSFLCNPVCPKCANKKKWWDNGVDLLLKIQQMNSNLFYLEEYKGYDIPIKFIDYSTDKVFVEKPEYLYYLLEKNKEVKNRIYIKRKEEYKILKLYPDIEKFLKDKNEIRWKDISSSDNVTLVCPDCGGEKQVQIRHIPKILSCGYACSYCSDNISYPNKLIRNVLSYFKFDYLKFEYKPEWSNNKIYDVYFELGDSKYIIEMDGSQHTKDKGWGKNTLEERKNIDALKDKMAKEHNIFVIRIDCEKSDINYIKNNIYNSLLKDILDLSIINWDKVEYESRSSLVLKICNFYKDNPDKTMGELGEIFNVSKCTALRYVKIGVKLGLCEYDPLKYKMNNLKKADEAKRKKVKMVNIKIGEEQIFNSITDCANYLYSTEKSIKSFDSAFSMVSSICRNKRKNKILKDTYTFEYVN